MTEGRQTHSASWDLMFGKAFGRSLYRFQGSGTHLDNCTENDSKEGQLRKRRMSNTPEGSEPRGERNKGVKVLRRE